MSLIILSGCGETLLPFSQNTNYQITGMENDQDTKQYLEKIIQERVTESIDYDEGSDDFILAETAREQTMAADILKALKAKGYYGAEVEYVDDANQTLQGTYNIKAGSVYTISSLTFSNESIEEYFDNDRLKVGDPLEAQPVLEAQGKLYEALQKDNCYFSLDVNHAVILDEASQTAQLSFEAQIGAPATFGPAIFEGQESMKESFLRKMVTWKVGDCFRKEKIRSLQTVLLETGLFVRVDSVLPETPNEDGSVPITIQLKERVHRSIKAGLSYYTDEGAGAALGWEHRNIFGSGEKLEAELNISQINQSFDVDFTKPFFLRKDQSLEINSALRQQNTDAFEETAFDVGANIKRQFNKRLSANVGVQLSLSEITDENDTQSYGLVSFPVSVVFDNRDDTLDPHKGWRLNAGIEPFYDAFGESDPFNKFEAGARTYFAITEKPDVVLGVRANMGSIVGGDKSNIPATERFYAGGGGTVRGFGYQQVGPYEDGNPTGGLSVITGSTEIRMKFTRTLGGVAFIDAGSVSDSAMPDFDSFSLGAGVGLRYYTDFGPLRFDVAVPLNQTQNLDQTYQFYISIGQAF